MSDSQNNIYAKVLADSMSPLGDRMTTFEVQFPKVLLAEANTHRLLSRNYSSSRAIPNAKFVDVESFEPQYYGLNQAGMMAKLETIDEPEKAAKIWKRMIKYCKAGSKMLNELKLHKQWSNRPNDWHTMVKGVISSTEWKNFLWLRFHESAQPEFQELARLISWGLDSNKPVLLREGEWHLPYVESVRTGTGNLIYVDCNGKELTLENAQKVSSSCCAQVSYRNLDQSLEKSIDIYDKLVGSDRKHSSAFEHCATPMQKINLGKQVNCMQPHTWERGITHMRNDGSLWSGNLQGWIQYRQLIPGEAVW